jgi:hypothetical protein
VKRIAPLLFVLLGGCAMQHDIKLAPIHVEPIRVEMDVNVNVREPEDTAVTSGGDDPATPSADDDRHVSRPSDADRPRDGG